MYSAPFSAYREIYHRATSAFGIRPDPARRAAEKLLRSDMYQSGEALNSIFGNQKPCYSPERVPTCQNSRHIHRYQNIPLDDKKHSQCSEGETMGLFQLNGSGARYLKELKPTTIHDVKCHGCLYRPGPMDTIPPVRRAKAQPHLVSTRPADEKYLDQSYALSSPK